MDRNKIIIPENLLGTKSDGEIAVMFGVHRRTIFERRKKLAIPKYVGTRYRPKGLKYKKHKENPTSFKKGLVPWNKGMEMDNPPWNKGLTKETDNRIKQYADTLKIVKKGKKPKIDFENKEYRKHVSERMKGENNPAKRKEVKKKIRETLLKTYKNHPEIIENRKASGINQFSKHFSSLEKLIANELILQKIPFVHNWKIGRYFADFVIYDRIVIECDGEYWHKDKKKEQKRDGYLHSKGYFVFHFGEDRIIKSPAECINVIAFAKKELLNERCIQINGLYMPGVAV